VVRVCAWCCRFLGLKRPVQRWTVTHGICPSCAERVARRAPGTAPSTAQVLVVSRDPLGVEAASALLGRATSPMSLLIDRRRTDRRRKHRPTPTDRRGDDRRAPPPASWADGYLVVESTASLEIERELTALALG
jgi:hypothetical protein